MTAETEMSMLGTSVELLETNEGNAGFVPSGFWGFLGSGGFWGCDICVAVFGFTGIFDMTSVSWGSILSGLSMTSVSWGGWSKWREVRGIGGPGGGGVRISGVFGGVGVGTVPALGGSMLILILTVFACFTAHEVVQYAVRRDSSAKEALWMVGHMVGWAIVALAA